MSLEDNLPIQLAESIQKVIEKEGFIKYKIDKRHVTKGVKILAELYEIDIKGKTINGDKEVNIFVKKIPDIAKEVNIISVKDVYKYEQYFYKELSKMFEKLQDDANIPSEERFKIIKVYEDYNFDLVIMENIAKKGFVTYNRMDAVSLKFLELSVKNIAKFHGLSMVLKEKQVEYFNENIKVLRSLLVDDACIKYYTEIMAATAINYVDDDLKEKVSKLYKNLAEKRMKFSNDETIQTCLCHGNYRASNIMMKEADGEVKEVISIDYQAIHYGCPVADLLNLIYLCTDYELRKAHLSNLKNLYYDTLQSFLKYFNLEADTIYPRKEYERVFVEKNDYGLLVALNGLPVIFASGYDTGEVIQKSDPYYQLDDRFKERLRGVIIEFIELGII